VELQNIEMSQSPENKFREYLTSRPRAHRYTERQRDMVNYIFSQHNHFMADQLIDEMKQKGFHVSRATVYRTLNKLVDAGLLRRLEIGPATYFETRLRLSQHEHLVCQKCHKMVEFSIRAWRPSSATCASNTTFISKATASSSAASVATATAPA